MKRAAGTSVIGLLQKMGGLRIISVTDQCIEWIGARRMRGYGSFYDCGKQVLAHRFIWEMSTGKKIPHGKVVMHTCDNPPCVNPKHLKLGTHKENVEDCNRKGRRKQVSCEKHGMAILTPEQVREIRKRYVPRKVTLEFLAKEFGVTMAAIHDIIRGRSWKNLP
jgi:Predicted DNA binding protein